MPLVALAACSGELSALDPAGPAAARVETLWRVMLAGAGIILAGVMGTALYALATSGRERRFSTRRVLTGWGLVFPALTLAALMAFAFLEAGSLRARGEGGEPVILARAERWGWTFAYPGGTSSRDVLHVPAGRTFTVAITSTDVIHSFWVPRLGGKIDAVPGKVNRLRLAADLPGTYYGLCSEYCGVGHADMQFTVKAHAPAEYSAALAAGTGGEGDPIDLPPPREAPAGERIERGAQRVFEALGLE